MVAFESAEHPADLVNYGERAWCRLETYMFMCVGEILMRPIHYFGFGMMPGEKGVCFLEEYIIPTSVQPASLPARPHTFYHPPFFIFREGCEKLEDAIHETSNPFTLGAQTDILRRQVTNNPDRPFTYPSACLPACPPTSASSFISTVL